MIDTPHRADPSLKRSLIRLLPLALLLMGAAEPQVAARSRLWLRLDPAVKPNPDGTQPSAIGSFGVVARGDYEAEASGWIARLPGAAARAEDVVSGDVATLLGRGTWGPTSLTLGRQWTAVGEQRLESLDGAVARFAWSNWLDVALRGGVAAPRAGEAFGDSAQLGGEAAFRLAGVRLALGTLNHWPEEAAVRTRLTASADYFAERWSLSGAATMAAQARALAQARVEAAWRPIGGLWLRGYARRARIDLLLAADELLAVFAEDARDELGGLAEWLVVPGLRLRGDAALVGGEAARGGRGRAGVDLEPSAGARISLEATGRSQREGRSGQARVGARAPIRGSVFGTVEGVGDVDPEDALAGLVRLGAGFEPWAGWSLYGAVEAAHTERWPYRVGGLLMLEHTLGAPPRWGGVP